MYAGSQEYYDYLNSYEWKMRAQERREIDGHQCVLCQCSTRPLEVHHLTYKHLGDEPMDDLITVCNSCHRVVTRIGKLLEDDSLISDYLLMERYTQQYKNAMNQRIAQIILLAVKEQYGTLQEQLNGLNAARFGIYVRNLMQAVDERYQRKIELCEISPESIGSAVTYGTFKNGRTQLENIDRYLDRDLRRMLPPMPKRRTWGAL